MSVFSTLYSLHCATLPSEQREAALNEAQLLNKPFIMAAQQLCKPTTSQKRSRDARDADAGARSSRARSPTSNAAVAAAGRDADIGQADSEDIDSMPGAAPEPSPADDDGDAAVGVVGFGDKERQDSYRRFYNWKKNLFETLRRYGVHVPGSNAFVFVTTPHIGGCVAAQHTSLRR